MAVDCSELARNLAELAFLVGADPKFGGNIDKVLVELQKQLPELTRVQLVDNINEFMDFQADARKQLESDLAKLKKEARTDKSLRNRIEALEEALATREAPPVSERGRRQLGTEAIETLRQRRDELTEETKGIREEAKQTRSIQQRIEDLKEAIAQRETAPRVRGTGLKEASDKLKALRLQRDELTKLANLGARIKTIEDAIAKREAAPRLKGTRKADAEAVEKLRRQRDELTQQANVGARIAALEKSLETGTLPAEQAKEAKPVSPTLRALRDLRKELVKNIRKSDPAVIRRLNKTIARMEKQLIDGNFAQPVRAEEVPGNKEIEQLTFRSNQLRNKINSKIRELKPKGVWGTIAEPLNVARAIMTSFDFSAALRQGGFFVIGAPIRSARAFPTLFKSLSKQGQARVEAEIQARANAPLYARFKLFIAETVAGQGLAKQEEAVMSRWAEHIPIVAASQRAYTSFLNKLRADTFDALAVSFAKNGELTTQEGLALANFINVATGRGSLGTKSFEKAAVAMNTTFFAPRYVASRFELIMFQPLWKGTGRTRVLIAREYAKYIVGLGILYALAWGAGYDIEEDPRSSDFGKLKKGRTRLDPLSGIAQVTVFSARIALGKRKSTKSGRLTSLRKDVQFGRGDTAGLVGDFIRSKLAPIPGSTLDFLSGSNIIGEKSTFLGELQELVTPLALGEVIDIMQEEGGLPEKSAQSLAVIFGIGAQVHKPRKK